MVSPQSGLRMEAWNRGGDWSYNELPEREGRHLSVRVAVIGTGSITG